MRFVVAGKISRDRERILKTIFSEIELPSGLSRFDLPDEIPKSIKSPIYIVNETVDNIYFYIDTFMKKRMLDFEVDALSMVNSMLTETLHSKILGTAREQGLVYGLSSSLGQTKLSSNWWIGAQVMPKNTKELFRIITKELSEVFNGNISKDDIDSIKQYSLGKFQRSGQTVGGIANRYAGRYFFDEFIDDYYQIPERIQSVNKQRIVDISKSMFSDNVWGLGILGNCGEEFVDSIHDSISILWN